MSEGDYSIILSELMPLLAGGSRYAEPSYTVLVESVWGEAETLQVEQVDDIELPFDPAYRVLLSWDEAMSLAHWGISMKWALVKARKWLARISSCQYVPTLEQGPRPRPRLEMSAPCPPPWTEYAGPHSS